MTHKLQEVDLMKRTLTSVLVAGALMIRKIINIDI